MVNKWRIVRGQVVKTGVIPCYASERGSEVGTALIGILAGNNQFFGWLPVGLKVVVSKTNGSVDRR